MPILSTPRLTLHPLTKEDAGDIFEVRGDPEAMAFWDWPNDESLTATGSCSCAASGALASRGRRCCASWRRRGRSDWHRFVRAFTATTIVRRVCWRAPASGKSIFCRASRFAPRVPRL